MDDQAEFKLLTTFLNLDTSFERIYEVPTELQDNNIDESAFVDAEFENTKYGILGATSLTSDLRSQITLMLQECWVEIPAAMNLLVPSGTFQLVQLPGDF
jgi:hypothetical protein